MPEPNNECLNLQKSVSFCEGTPVMPGIRRRIYYIAKSAIMIHPKLPQDDRGRFTSAIYDGDYVLAADQTWKHIDILAAKSTLVSAAQNEQPSQIQQDTLTAIHQTTGAEASGLAASLNNCDNIFLVPDARGIYRVVGSEFAEGNTTVAMDLGQGPTGTASTTITHVGYSPVPLPEYHGKIETEDGVIMGDGSAVPDGN